MIKKLIVCLMVVSIGGFTTAQEQANPEVVPKSTASRLRELLKQFEDDPVQPEVDRQKLLDEVRLIIEKLNRNAPSPSDREVQLAGTVTTPSDSKKGVDVVTNKPTTPIAPTGGLTASKSVDAPKSKLAEPFVQPASATVNKTTVVKNPADPPIPSTGSSTSLEERIIKLEQEVASLNKKLEWLNRQVRGQ